MHIFSIVAIIITFVIKNFCKNTYFFLYTKKKIAFNIFFIVWIGIGGEKKGEAGGLALRCVWGVVDGDGGWG